MSRAATLRAIERSESIKTDKQRPVFVQLSSQTRFKHFAFFRFKRVRSNLLARSVLKYDFDSNLRAENRRRAGRVAPVAFEKRYSCSHKTLNRAHRFHSTISHSDPANRECYARPAEGRAFPSSLAATAVIIVNDDLNFSVPVRLHRSHTDRRTEHTIDAIERTPSIALRLQNASTDVRHAKRCVSEQRVAQARHFIGGAVSFLL